MDNKIVKASPYKCDFLLHAECSTLMLPAITYEGHGHLLQFRDHNIEENKLDCRLAVFADTIFVNHIPSLVSIVILISILPVVHYHILSKLNVIYIPLSLQILHFKRKTRHTNCTVMLVRKERDPLLSIYHCAECHYVAELKCVISRVT